MTGTLLTANRLLAYFLLVVAVACCPSAANAAKPMAAKPSAPRPVTRSEAQWHILETTNFRVLAYGTRPVDPSAGQACELLRTELYSKWADDASPATWTPKCDVVLHPSDASYLKEVGAGAASTVASSLVDQQRGRTRLRRIDVRSIDSDWQTAALPHEMTHVVLADRFAGQSLPRWIDEGLAILADPADKRLRHRAEMSGAIANRSAFRIVELLTLDDYPAANRWGTFYGQSASVVEYLVDQKTPADFVQFAELALEQGYDASLRKIYGIAGIPELERNWYAQAGRSEPRTIQASMPVTARGHRVPTTAAPAGSGEKFATFERSR